MRKEKYSVDVVIPTYKPDSKFDKLLFMLQRQQYPIENIWIINTKAGKFPKQIKETDQIHIHHIEPKDFDHGATRDKGMQMSNAEIVVFMTQDAVPEDEFVIGKLVEALDQDEKIGAAYAKQLAENGCNIIETYTRTFNYPEKSMIKTAEDIPRLGIKTFFCSNVCAAYRRSVYEKMGGFCKRTIFNEDMILAGNMVLSGYKIAYAAEAKVIHSHNYTGMQQFHRNFDMAVSQAEHPEVFNFLGHPEYEEFYKKIKNMVDKGETKYYALALTGEKEDLEDMCSGLSGYVTSISDADEDEDLMYSLINSNIDPTHSIYSGTEYE